MENKDEHLIIAYLEGTLTSEETDAFFVWLELKPENKKLFFDIKDIRDKTLFSNEPFDPIRSWEVFVDKHTFSKHNYMLISRTKTILSYAAVLLFAVLSSALYFKIQISESEEQTISFNTGENRINDIVSLPDGSSVNLISGTKLSIKNDYGNKKRIVYLEGEAFFKVAKQTDKPFIVKINGQEIEALGTMFSVKAYPNDSLCVTTLLEGSVRLSSEKQEKEITLKPNDQMVYNRDKGCAEVCVVDAEALTSWTTGKYYFPQQNFSDIVKRLKELYGVDIVINSDEIRNTQVSGTFQAEQSIYEIMDIFACAMPIQYTVEKRKISINKKFNP